jgi:hypothetical protein
MQWSSGISAPILPKHLTAILLHIYVRTLNASQHGKHSHNPTKLILQ